MPLPDTLRGLVARIRPLLARVQPLVAPLRPFFARVRLLLARVPRPVWIFALSFSALLAVASLVVVGYYARIVTRTMEGRRFSLPTRIYSDVWVVRPGDALGPEDVLRRLARLRYAEVATSDVLPGTVFPARGRLTIGLRDRETPWGRFAGFRVRIEFSGRRVAAIRRAEDGEALPFAVFEPEVVGSVFDEKMEDRTLVRLPQVPKVLVDAILTAEDRDFFSHGGISLKRIAGAALKDLRHRSAAQGGSTLTQQLVKNLFLRPDRTLKRKAVEAIMALVLEAKYSKDEILEAYLNEIYLGQRGSISVTGFEEASRFYFGKSVAQVELPEAALLAGIISSPGRYSPFRSPERAKVRRAWVLKSMRELGKIDEKACAAALEAPLTKVVKPATGIVAPHFVDFVLGQVKESPETLQKDGLSIFTTLDPDMQNAAQAAVQHGLDDLEKRFKRLRARPGQEPLQAAIIAMDPATGSIRALVGGRDYQVSQFNRVVQAQRQPGSLFKPFVYLAAFSRRDLVPAITPATILSDTPIALVWGKGEDESWSPRDYDGEFLGPITLRVALEESRNIPCVRVAVTEVTPGKTLLPDVVAAARRAGITSELKPYPSVSLGAFEVSPLEIASAYAILANGGYRMRPNALIGIVGPNGRKVETRDTPVERAADADAVAVLDSMLQGVVNRGTGSSARRLGAQGIFAGKTGTTNDGRDAWFIGFSPRLLVAVWVGFDDNRGLNLSGSMAAVPMFADFARRLPAHYFEAPFPETPGTVQATIDPTTGYLVTPECPHTASEVFVAGTEPTERCPVHGGGDPGPGLGF